MLIGPPLLFATMLAPICPPLLELLKFYPDDRCAEIVFIANCKLGPPGGP